MTMITQEYQDWNRAAMDHISRRDEGWPAHRILTRFHEGVLTVWSVLLAPVSTLPPCRFYKVGWGG